MLVEPIRKELYCHTTGAFVTAGKTYPVIEETESYFKIRDDDNAIHGFSKYPAYKGTSYEDWFYLSEVYM
jgi:hypothetical protein